MKVAIAAWDWPSIEGGGVAALTRTLAVGLAAEGAEVTVWTRGGGDRAGRLARAKEPPGVAVIGLPGRSWRKRGHAHWRRAAGRIEASSPELLIVGSWDALPGLLDGLPSQRRMLCFAHGRDICAPLPTDRDAARRAALADPRVTWLGLTRWMRARLLERGVPPERIRVVPAAVPAPPVVAQRTPRPLRTLLTVARLIPRKGHDLVPAALDRLSADLRWHVVGDGPQRETLPRDRADTVVHGALSDDELEQLWADADLFVLPCRDQDGDVEGYGLVFLEAAARGLPSVAGRSGGAPEAVLDGVTGWVVEPKPASLAEALRAAAPETLALRGRAARQRWLDGHQPQHLARAVLGAA